MDAIVDLLRPDALAHLFLYVLFFLGLVLLFVMPEKNEIPQYLVFALIFIVIIDFLRTRDPNGFPVPGAEHNGFFTFLIHIAMAMIPFIVAGMTRKQGRKGGAVIPIGLLTGFIAGLYALLSFVAIPMVYNKFGG